MSIKRTVSQSYIQNRRSNDSIEQTQIKSSNMQADTSKEIASKKLLKLRKSTKQKRLITPDRLKSMRHVFTTISNSQSMPVELLMDALLALGHYPQKDICYQEFLTEHELIEPNGAFSFVLSFEQYVFIVLEYEEKLRIEEDALRRLDLKIAFEYFDLNKDGMIDASELSVAMNILGFPISDREAKEMINFADHDKDSLLSFDEFLVVLTQISAINASQNLRQ